METYTLMITAKNCALIIIDIQGKLATLMHDFDSFVTQTQILVNGAQTLQIPIIWAEQMPDKLGKTIPEVSSLLNQQTPTPKNTFSCCGNNALKLEISNSNKQHFLIAGIEAHICVFQTVTDLLEMEKTVHVISDATSSRTQQNKNIGINRMKESGAIISSVEMCLFEIMGKAGGDQFKAITKTLK